MSNKDTQIDALINQSIKIKDTPSDELNRNLKASLYQREAVLKRSTPTHSISLWYLPMILNFTLFALFAACAILLIANLYIAILVSSICVYICLSGIAITIIGVKRTKMGENMSFHVQKRGSLA